MSADGGVDYRSAGVDLERAEQDKEGFRSLLASTKDGLTLSDLGSFGGLYALPEHVTEPVLVSSADGVGTKLKVAFRAEEHRTIGQDLVNHCVNDVLVQGATPLFFLDYLATGVLEDGVVQDVVAGVAKACGENDCTLLGGETAQMPGFYNEGEYDLAGFIVGIVSRNEILDGGRVKVGDVLIALPSSGLHTNGYSLARRILFELAELEVQDRVPGLDETVAEALLKIHRSYLTILEPELRSGSLVALAHVTGGGLPGNLPRSLPPGLGALVQVESWEVPILFRALQELGSVTEAEMYRVFNMGIGMVAVAPRPMASSVLSRLQGAGERAWILGEVTEEPGVRFV